jgi:site-specific DNA recombinase
MGIIRIKGVNFNGGHEPLISPDLFNRVQAIIRGNTNQKVRKHEFKFSKLLSCKGCEYSLIAETQKGLTYYRCHTKGCITKGVRERTIDNRLLNEFAPIQLHPEESVLLDELLKDAENNWVKTQEEMLAAIKLQSGKIEQKLERLTDCYVEGGLDKETYEQRKEILLVESKTKQFAEREINHSKEKLFQKVRKFLELGKDLIKSYETGNLQEQREFVQIATSNLVVEGKKLMISMRSPFLELSQRHHLLFGAPGTNRTCIYSLGRNCSIH